MADEEVQNEEGEAAAPAKGSRLALLGAVVAVALGGVAGTQVLGPTVAGLMAASPGEEAGADSGGGHGDSGGGHGEAGGASVYSVENLVVNPAETKGTRFLMASVVAKLPSGVEAEALAGRDAEIRDRLLSLLASKTVDELADVSVREPLKEEIRAALSEMVAPAEFGTVYLPTFVIQ